MRSHKAVLRHAIAKHDPNAGRQDVLLLCDRTYSRITDHDEQKEENEEIKRMNNMLIRKIRALAHRECCNYIDGKCIEAGECTVINSRYPSIHDGAVDCDYFLECVLPIDPELNQIIWAELLREEDVIRPNERTCAWCGGAFIPNSGRQQYCLNCKPLHERLRNRDKQRSYYQRKQMKST